MRFSEGTGVPNSVQRGHWGAQCALIETLGQKCASVKVLGGAIRFDEDTVVGGGGGGGKGLSGVFLEHELW
jgi:hypothetical protein